MARPARLVLPGIPHHVTARGSRREPTFYSDDDYARYAAPTRLLESGNGHLGLVPDA